MRVSSMLDRWYARPAIRPRSGQITIFVALFLTATLGMVGLAVDVGHAYERRQFVQGAANNAARAGAFEVYQNHIAIPAWTTSTADQMAQDSAVAERMIDTLANSGLTVKNITTTAAHGSSPTLTTLTTPPGSPCSQHLAINMVYLQAVYIDGSTPPVPIYVSTDPSHTPVHVGTGAFPTTAGGYSNDAQGVQVTQLVMCVPHFFVGVLRYGNFNVGSNAFLSLSGLAETHTSTSGGVAPFYVFARKCQDTSPPSTPTCEQDPYSLYMPGAPDSQGSSTYGITYHASPPLTSCPTTPCSGDLVTLHDHSNGSGNWDAWQFVTPSAGMANVPSPALPLGSGSNRGCLDPNATNLTFGDWSFNQPGNGVHCGTPPSLGSYVVVPLVDYVCKNDSCGVTSTQDPTRTIGTCTTGGFCVRIIGFVQVKITQDLTTGKLIQGYITSVLQDPYCTVETPIGKHPAPPTASPPTTSPPAIYAPSAYGGSGSTWPTCPNAAS